VAHFIASHNSKLPCLQKAAESLSLSIICQASFIQYQEDNKFFRDVAAS
jgi:hypothetical protein